MGYRIADRSVSLPQVFRGVVVGVSLSPIIGAFLYNQGFRLSSGPCRFQHTFGIPSPACGMTRSFMAIARGDWSEAVMYHLFGPVLFAVLGMMAAQASIELVTGRSLSPKYTQWLTHPALTVTSILAFLAYYGVRLLARYHSESGMLADFNHPMWQLIVAGAKAL